MKVTDTSGNSPICSQENPLIDLSAQEVQTLMNRFGVPSTGVAAEFESLDLLALLGGCSQQILPAPQLVSVSSHYAH